MAKPARSFRGRARLACCVRIALTLSCFSVVDLQAQDVATGRQRDRSENAATSVSLPKIKMKTLGGKQLWGDVLFFRGWEIQQNVITKHYRLLDARDFRHAWGTYETCVEKLEQIRRQQKLEPMSGEVVVLLHGIVRSSKAMGRVRQEFAQNGFTVVPFDYPSTQVDLSTCAEYLDRVLKSLDGVEHINFVTHSMGGLVVRRWMKDHSDRRIRRMVMIGTPNKGAELADRLKDWQIFKLVLGPSGQQLVSDSGGAIAELPIPSVPFAVIAGAKGSPEGYNPLIPGDDDGIVAVESARLEGAADYMDVSVLHSFLPFDDRVCRASFSFIKTGALRESGKCRPIQKRPATEVANPESD